MLDEERDLEQGLDEVEPSLDGEIGPVEEELEDDSVDADLDE